MEDLLENRASNPLLRQNNSFNADRLADANTKTSTLDSSPKYNANLNAKFTRGGGTTTIINRIKQLKKTVDAQSGKKPIYLQIEGKNVEYVGGDGVYLEQPLNEDVL